MRSDPEGRLEAAITAYSLGDLEMAASYFDETAIYAIFVPADTVPFGGEVCGRAQILAKFQHVVQDFEFLRYEPRPILANGDQLRCQIMFALKHRETGEIIDGVMRIEVSFSKGMIVRWHEFHDADRIQAFMRLCKSRSQR